MYVKQLEVEHFAQAIQILAVPHKVKGKPLRGCLHKLPLDLC